MAHYHGLCSHLRQCEGSGCIQECPGTCLLEDGTEVPCDCKCHKRRDTS